MPKNSIFPVKTKLKYFFYSKVKPIQTERHREKNKYRKQIKFL